MRALNELQPGESGVVSRVGVGNPKMKRRLIDLGITPMTEVAVRRIAPLGDPIEVSLRGYSLSLRGEDAAAITIFAADELEQAKQKGQTEGRPAETVARQRDRSAHIAAAKLTDWYVGGQSGGMCPPGGCSACMGCGGVRKAIKRENQQACKSKTAADQKELLIGLVGNPNCGKTTLFNAMTGAKEYVGNWPGVTVEKKARHLSAYGHNMTVVDLPGIYSLSTYSMEEVVSRNFVIDDHPDAIINIVDATNLERNLYLSVQLLELERPMVLALNMMDEVKKQGVEIDCTKLALELGVPVVPICARTGEGVDELLRQCTLLLGAAHLEAHAGFALEPDHIYDAATLAVHHKLDALLGDAPERAGLPRHWATVKLMENDALVLEKLRLPPEKREGVGRILTAYAGQDALMDSETRVADSRYRYIERICASSIRRRKVTGVSTTDRIDAILTNKYLGIPIFLLIMGVIFVLTFDTLGGFLSDGVDTLINGVFMPWVQSLLTSAGAADWLISLLCDGVITGVGGVLTFLPQIALLFFFLAILEDSGYMSRTAFLMDRALKRFGLSGKSFIPMLMGFGCTVPAAMSARTMENETDRRMTILLLPFVSCSAKLPVYGMIASAFFERSRGLVVLSLYVLGVVVGIITGVLFKKTIFKKSNATFLMELPPYRVPLLKNILLHVGERVGHFLQKAGTIILAMSVLLWFLMHFDTTFAMTSATETSILGKFGMLIAPIFRPLGFDNWQASVALLTGIIAKESVNSSLSLFLGATGAELTSALSTVFTPLSAYAFLVFVLLYVPCIAAVATMQRELHSAKHTWFMIGYQLVTAYLVSFLIYSIGVLLL